MRRRFSHTCAQALAAPPGQRDIDFAFIGSLSGAENAVSRTWVLGFARMHFTAASYLVDTAVDTRAGRYTPLGPWDHTLSDDEWAQQCDTRQRSM